MSFSKSIIIIVAILTIIIGILENSPEIFGYYIPGKLIHSKSLTFSDKFGILSFSQLKTDISILLYHVLYKRNRFQIGISSLGLLYPSLSIPSYLGWIPINRKVPIYNLFDRTGGGKHFTSRVTRNYITDFRNLSSALSYDEHDGIDFVIPIGTGLHSSANGIIVMIRHNWLRGGLTIAIDHGMNIITTYTHCSKCLVKLGQIVKEGELIALSGAQGADLVINFPWVPPLVHYMVWENGTPIDPFHSKNEPIRIKGVWKKFNNPKPYISDVDNNGNIDIEKSFPISNTALDDAINACKYGEIKNELLNMKNMEPLFQAALLEEILHHELWAFDYETAKKIKVRSSYKFQDNAQSLKISLPLYYKHYDGIQLEMWK